MTGPLAVIEADELDRRIEEAVRRVLAERQPETAEWVDSEAAARVLSVHPKTAARMARTGEIPATRVGRAWRFHRSDLEQFLAAGGGA